LAPKLVIVEDDLTLQRALRIAFEKEGYSVVCAARGAEAVPLIEKEKPDLVILDVMLPGMSGYDVCRQLRQNPASATLPILMLSAMSQVSNKITGLDAGADDYVTKPFELAELAARVRMLLERTRRLRDSAPSKRARMLGFVGAKGGVGTTTVAVNVALALAKRKNSVILFEPQPYFGTVSQYLGLKPRWSWADIPQLPGQEISRAELAKYLTAHSRYLQVLAAPQCVKPQQTPPKGACSALTAAQGEMLVTCLAEMADYVVLDLPNSSLEAVRQALPRCDCPVVVMEPDSACVRAAQLTIELLELWGVPRQAVRIVIVRRAALAQPLNIPAIQTTLNSEVVGVVALAADLAAKAIESGKALIELTPDHQVAVSLEQLAARLAADAQ